MWACHATAKASVRACRAIGVEQGEQPVLVEQHKTDQDEAARQKMRDVEGEAIHHRLSDMKRSSVASRPSISATPMKSGTRNTRIFATVVSNRASMAPAAASLPA